MFRADSMESTPFFSDDPPEALKKIGVKYVGEPDVADIVIARSGKPFRRIRRLAKRSAIWTHEPRLDLHRKQLVNVRGVRHPVHIMNLHTGTLLADNYLFINANHIAVDRDIALRTFSEKPFRAAMLGTFTRKKSRFGWFLTGRSRRNDPKDSLIRLADGSLLLDGRNVDLSQCRQSLALHLRAHGFCDIYGRDWPRSTRISGESRSGHWEQAKQVILKDYAFNIAFENTIVPHYVTEKIWDAIRDSCLPIYHGSENRIYDDFPQGTYVEAGGKTMESLAQEIMQMGTGEAGGRYEACLDVYLRTLREDRCRDAWASMHQRTADFVEGIMDRPLER